MPTCSPGRGVGKTSTARILAKALNCPQVHDAIPCNVCEVCQSISAGSDVDVLEIDGASNRGIDDIRSLRANVTIKAMRSPYKVYIIDEVHMLTKEAFNALLKTLEEPPPNVKFVFCTTEPNKVPDTILSRCQRFDFGAISTGSIQARLQQIAEAEGVAVEPAALELLARRAGGSMRDSQSLFDQLLAFGGDPITADDVHRLLGTASDDRLTELIEACIDRRRDEVLRLMDAALAAGVQVGSLSDQLLHGLRDLMIVAVGADDVTLLGVAETERERLTTLAQRWSLSTITAAQQILAETKARMQRGGHDRAFLELALIRLSLLEELTELGALLTPRGGTGGDASAPRQPAAPRSQAGPSAGGSDHPSSPRQTGTQNASTSRIDQSDPEVEPGIPRKTIEFVESSESEFVSELLSLLPDKVSSHFRKSESIAIVGPNRLEMRFTRSYFLSKQFCERPETQARVRDLASQIAGRPIEVAILACENESEAVAAPSPQPARLRPVRREVMSADGDPYVQQAVSIFGGRLEDVRRVHDSTTQDKG